VFKIHPKTFLTSSKRPSTLNFFIEIMSSLGMTSRSSDERAIEYMASGIALERRFELSPKSGVIPMVSSI